jgi:hypothetical protein
VPVRLAELLQGDTGFLEAAVRPANCLGQIRLQPDPDRVLQVVHAVHATSLHQAKL